MSLKVDYKEDIFSGDNRKYNLITNDDGTVSLEDVTEYIQEGDVFGAGDINATNEAVNDLLIETGTVGPLTYYKYADGRLTYVVNATTSATITTASGGIYISALRSMATYTYPVPFAAIPAVTASVGGNGHTSYCWIAITGNLTVRDAPPDYYICRGSSDSESKSYRVCMIIEGRWK